MNEIIAVLGAVGVGYALAVVTWLFYLAVMSLAPHRHTMSPVARAHAYVLLGVGFALDFVLNVVVGTVLFLKLPQDWLLTGRLERYINDQRETRWRRALALWICFHLLDQFDPKGSHCGRR